MAGGGTILQGWALTAQGRSEDGLAQMRHGLTNCRATGTVLDLPWYLGVLAEAYGNANRVDAGLATIAEALAVADKAGYYEAELYRLKGELLRQHRSPTYRKWKPVCSRPSRWLGARRPSPWSCARP